MMNLGGPEMLLLAILALIMFGPKRLPELGKALGEGISAFRESSRQLRQDFTRQLEDETREPEAPRSVPPEVLLPNTIAAARQARAQQAEEMEVAASETEMIDLEFEDEEEAAPAALPTPAHAAPMGLPRPAAANEEAPAQG